MKANTHCKNSRYLQINYCKHCAKIGKVKRNCNTCGKIYERKCDTLFICRICATYNQRKWIPQYEVVR